MTQFRKILCPTDFSENAEHALLYAKALAESNGASIDCINLLDLSRNLGLIESGYVSDANISHPIELIEEHAREQLAQFISE
jgi:nucleotide-binding universal stress UspA family protein